MDRPEAQSVIRGGALDGVSLRTAIERHPDAIMGPRWAPDRKFPILVKWLDCRERLSLQVHPPAAVAGKLGGEPKTENWFIAGCEPGSTLTVGMKRGVSRQAFEQALGAGKLEECVHSFPVSEGESILVRSGQIHAIGAGNLILEIQQNSDTTYRVYDWGRVGLDGKARNLHVRESLASIDWTDFEPQPLHPVDEPVVILADAPEFRIRRVRLARGGRLQLAAGVQPRILSVVSGCIQSAGEKVVRGENVLLPFAAEAHLEAHDETVLLLTENFC